MRAGRGDHQANGAGHSSRVEIAMRDVLAWLLTAEMHERDLARQYLPQRIDNRSRLRDKDIPRDGLSAAIPAGWTLLPPDPSRPGKQLVAPGGEGRLVVDATPAGGNVTARMNAYASRDGEKVTYHKRGGSWIVVSGFRGDDRIFYRKAMLACSNTRWHEIEFEYAAAQKRAYDQFVTQASHGLSAHGNEGCGARRASR